MFSAQDNNNSASGFQSESAISQIPQQPVSPPVTQVQAPASVPPTPPQMVNTTATVAMPGKKKFSHKLLFLIPIVLLIGTMVVVAAILPALRKTTAPIVQETPTPTLVPATPLPTVPPNALKDWKEYLNRDAQLSFRYPPTLSLKEFKTTATTYEITLANEASASATVMKIVSARNTTALDLLNSESEIDPAIKTSETNIDVSGIATKQTLSTLINNPATAVLYTLVEQDTNAYNFVWYAPTDGRDVYSQVLGSVKFVTQGITPDWQTYTNTLGNYSLRFPPTWNLNTSDDKASASAQTVSIRKNPTEAQFQNLVIQTTVSDAKTKVELSASELVSSIQNLAGWQETPTLDFRTIGGSQAEVLSGAKDGSWYVYTVLWYRNVLVEISWRDTALRQEQDTFNDMLGSMKFK